MKLPLSLCLVALAATAPAQDVVAVKAGRLIPISGEEIQNAVILIENGRIKAVGADLEVPWDAKVIDATSKVVMPTYVLAHCSSGMDSSNENLVNVPYLTVRDAVDPSSTFFEEALRNGVGTIHVIPGNRTLLGGTGMIVKPVGKTIDEMAVRAHTGVKMSLDASGGSRMAQIHKMRRALEEVHEYLEGYERRKKEFDEEKAAGATGKKELEEKLDEKKQPIVELLQGKARAWLYVPSTAELFEARRLVEKYGIDVVIVLGHRVHQATTLLSETKQPLVLDDNMEYEEIDPETDEIEKHCPAALLSKAGREYALSINGRPTAMERYPWWQMATAIRNGVDRRVALEAMTIVPARILGLDAELGTIESGKVANLQILSGDPLAATSWVEQVLLDGRIVYERDKDHRLEHLFGKSEPVDDSKKASAR